MANRGCFKQPMDKRPVYAACTQECVSSAFSAFGTTQIKDLPCYQYLGKFNSVPGHHISNDLSPAHENLSAHGQPMILGHVLNLLLRCSIAGWLQASVLALPSGLH